MAVSAADVHFALRSLRRQPLLCAGVIGLLSLGLGGVAAAYTVVDTLYMKPLAVHDAGNLYRVVTIQPNLGPRGYFLLPFLQALRREARLTRGFFAWTDFNVSAVANGAVVRARACAVSGEYFAELGLRPALGRLLTPDDDVPGRPLAAVLSDAWWRRAFHADPQVIGRTIHLRDAAVTVVGVLPASFTDLTIEISPDVRVPLHAIRAIDREEIYRRLDEVQVEIGLRLAPGASVAQAGQEVLQIYTSSRAGAGDKDPHLELESLRNGMSSMRRQFGASALALLAGVLLLLVMVGANVASLLLMRALARGREFAVRRALGASRMRVAALVAWESALLGAGGLAGGLLLAGILLRLLHRAIPSVRLLDATSLPLALTFSLDARLAGLAALLMLVVVTGVTFAAALWAGRADLREEIAGVRSTGPARARAVLVGVQVALCTLLLAGGLLFWRTHRALDRLDPGFDRDRVVNFSLAPGSAGYTEPQAEVLRRRLADEVRVLPGVETVAWSGRGLMRGTGIKSTFAPVGVRVERSDFLNTSLNAVSPEYFQTMGIRLLAGRVFNDADRDRKEPPRPVVVNQAFLRRFFPGHPGSGARFGHALEKIAKTDFEVIGVVSDARYRSLREPVPPIIYSPLSDASEEALLVVRTARDPASLIGPVQAIMRKIDPRLPLFDIHTLGEEVDHSLWRERLLARLALALALAAALLAGAGLHALLAYFVLQRAREIGIRSALGATPAAILHWIGAQALVLLAVGAAAGLVFARLLSPRLEPLLTGGVSLGLSSALAIAILVLAVGAAALAAPARRALRTDAAVLLRSE